MAGLDIPTGVTTGHGNVVEALHDGSGITAVAGVTPVAGQLTPADQGPVFDAQAQQADIIASGAADVAAVQASGMDARTAMLGHYEAQAMPLGGAIGDPMSLPPVPDNALPPAQSDEYPWAADEPVPAGAPVAYVSGDVPDR